jgi:N-acetylglutamate synthase-like GNAT family acetyltransferase/protein-tyrosine-phosphatase
VLRARVLRVRTSGKETGIVSRPEQRGVALRRAEPTDYEAVENILRELELPTDGVKEWLDRFWVGEHEGTVVGIAGMERYGDAALLRSVAVAPAWQGGGVGRALIDRVLEDARTAGIQDVFLLTTTAEPYFVRLGFTRVERDCVPAGVRASAEFRGACPDSAVVMRRPATKVLRVLFLCTGNSARSQMAVAILNQKSHGRFVAESAGSHPAQQVHPLAVETLERYGYLWTGGRPKGLDGLTEQPWDFVMTVCDRAKEACPFFPGQPLIAHWGMPDPAAVQGTDEERRRAFDEALLTISRRLELFLALPVTTLSRLALDHHLRAIGQALPE